MSDPTLEVYEAGATRWRTEREASVSIEGARALGEAAARHGDRPVADLGCGPGWHSAALGRRPIAVDAAWAMLEHVPDFAPAALRVRADLRALPFQRGALGGAYGSKSYVHLPRHEVPLALADLHRTLAVGAPVELVLFSGDWEHGSFTDDSFAGRRFSLWPEGMLRDVLVGAGFGIEELETFASRRGDDHFRIRLTRQRTLPDTVGATMRLLVCGLNPSVYAADRGVGFARPGNRFWPAALAAGLVHRDRDPISALVTHGVGMTDLVKRATRSSAELAPDEYRAGLDRVRRLAEWLRPAVVCFVGLEGWRTAVDRKATAGVQAEQLAGTPVYVMPSTSGLNAHSRLDDLTTHLRHAAALAAGQ